MKQESDILTQAALIALLAPEKPVHKAKREIRDLEARGMPVIRITQKRKLYPLPDVKEWLRENYLVQNVN